MKGQHNTVEINIKHFYRYKICTGPFIQCTKFLQIMSLELITGPFAGKQPHRNGPRLNRLLEKAEQSTFSLMHTVGNIDIFVQLLILIN